MLTAPVVEKVFCDDYRVYDVFEGAEEFLGAPE
jgi:hypothetical protein